MVHWFDRHAGSGRFIYIVCLPQTHIRTNGLEPTASVLFAIHNTTDHLQSAYNHCSKMIRSSLLPINFCHHPLQWVHHVFQQPEDEYSTIFWCPTAFHFTWWYWKSRMVHNLLMSRRMNESNLKITYFQVIVAVIRMREKTCIEWPPSICRTQIDWPWVFNMRANSSFYWNKMSHLYWNVLQWRLNRRILSTISDRSHVLIHANKPFGRRWMVLVFALCSFVI